MLEQCSSGLYWNQNILGCDWPASVDTSNCNEPAVAAIPPAVADGPPAVAAVEPAISEVQIPLAKLPIIQEIKKAHAKKSKQVKKQAKHAKKTKK